MAFAAYPGPDEDFDSVGASGWSLKAYVRGDYCLHGGPLLYNYYQVTHEGNRSRWYSIIPVGNLIIYYYHLNYRGQGQNSTIVVDGWGARWTVTANEANGEFYFAGTKSFSWFHDWLWQQTWNASTRWVRIVAEPPPEG